MLPARYMYTAQSVTQYNFIGLTVMDVFRTAQSAKMKQVRILRASA